MSIEVKLADTYSGDTQTIMIKNAPADADTAWVTNFVSQLQDLDVDHPHVTSITYLWT